MAHNYLPQWLTGSEALAHIKRVAECSRPEAFALLQRACRDEMVECRPRMSSEDRRAYEQRGLAEPEPRGWRARYIDSDTPADNDKSFWDDFDRQCEFSGDTIREHWPDAAPAAVLAESQPENSSQADRAKTLSTWMRGYAQSVKAASKILKRDGAIDAACKEFGCTYREAEAAYEALPYPNLRNPPRIAKD